MRDHSPVIEFQFYHAVLTFQQVIVSRLSGTFGDIDTHHDTTRADNRNEEHDYNQCCTAQIDAHNVDMGGIRSRDIRRVLIVQRLQGLPR